MNEKMYFSVLFRMQFIPPCTHTKASISRCPSQPFRLWKTTSIGAAFRLQALCAAPPIFPYDVAVVFHCILVVFINSGTWQNMQWGPLGFLSLRGPTNPLLTL